jgi:hypothetical protein
MCSRRGRRFLLREELEMEMDLLDARERSRQRAGGLALARRLFAFLFPDITGSTGDDAHTFLLAICGLN